MIPLPLPIKPSMEMSPLFLILPLLLVILLHCIKRKKTRSSSSSASTSKSFLPPGTMGWPFIGETFQLYSSNTNNFFAEKQRRYGPVFKTHILGCPCIMVSSPEAARFVLLTKANLFKPTFPASKERILGSQAIFFQEGEYHSRLRRLVLRAFMPESIRRKIAGIEEIAVRMLSSCDGRLICSYQEMKTYALNVSLLSIFGKEERSSIEELKQCYYILEKGYNSMPVNMPGTLFHKALRARKQLGLLVERIISSRRKLEGTDQFVTGDLLASFMETKEALSDDQIAHNIIGVIFAARDTTASVLTWILKYLAENPAILQAVTDEQEEIRRSKEMIGGDKEECGLNWDDTKRMPITCRVIQETLRIASILSFTFREAAQDVEYEDACKLREECAGYLIPKGWKVLPLFRNIHHSPDNFPEPEKFDPSRFEVTPKPNTYMPFGNGIHACPGNELAKLEILVFLHHLTINYRWSISGSNSGFQFGPFALPLDGLPITIHRLQQENKLISSN